jgi:PhzF family phenazine biosynthesis protein
MRLRLYHVDAFADRVFTGNPAAVVPLDDWLPDATLQSIAAENALSETAFLVRAGDARWDLRWFTPTTEVDLCGHATLASAFVIATILAPGDAALTFRTRMSGELTVTREGDVYTLDLPSRPPVTAVPAADLVAALGAARPREVLAARDWLVCYDDPAHVQTLRPDIARLAHLDRMVIVTAPGEDVDFVSRFFAPGAGVPEDPVTGSAHCTLVPYWAARLGKERLEARQVSARGGRLHCALVGDRVQVGGRAVLYLEGTIQLQVGV